mmetsp:Transcript_96101/g.276764  ORF Transcript_96101/g.276764 Transcript_96101/m.276764 type:complete len:248 (+) Transcript_96101:927-1670(+)
MQRRGESALYLDGVVPRREGRLRLRACADRLRAELRCTRLTAHAGVHLPKVVQEIRLFPRTLRWVVHVRHGLELLPALRRSRRHVQVREPVAICRLVVHAVHQQCQFGYDLPHSLLPHQSSIEPSGKGRCERHREFLRRHRPRRVPARFCHLPRLGGEARAPGRNLPSNPRLALVQHRDARLRQPRVARGQPADNAEAAAPDRPSGRPGRSQHRRLLRPGAEPRKLRGRRAGRRSRRRLARGRGATH